MKRLQLLRLTKTKATADAAMASPIKKDDKRTNPKTERRNQAKRRPGTLSQKCTELAVSKLHNGFANEIFQPILSSENYPRGVYATLQA